MTTTAFATPAAFTRARLAERGYPMTHVFLATDPGREDGEPGLGMEAAFPYEDLVVLLDVCYPAKVASSQGADAARRRIQRARVRKLLDIADQHFEGITMHATLDREKGSSVTSQTVIQGDFDFMAWSIETEEGRRHVRPGLAKSMVQFIDDLRQQIIKDCGEVYEELQALKQ